MTAIASAALAYTPEVAAATRPLYERVSRIIPSFEWPVHAPLVDAINRLKRERNAVILAHNYQTPEIFHCVADIVGDSLALAQRAAETDADVIVLAGVHFMAETAKLLNPEKIVLIPDVEAGCSLAESITPEDVRLLRQAYPGVPVITYVNTSAAVKAECDICCTSGNAVKVVESLGRRSGDLPARRVSRELRGDPDQGADHQVEGPLRGARALHRRRNPQLPQGIREPGGDRPSGVPAGRAGSRRLRRIHRADDRLRPRQAAGEGADGHGVLDERQRRRRSAGRRVRAPLQPVPAHEADHAVQHPPLAADACSRGSRSTRRSRARARRAVERMLAVGR